MSVTIDQILRFAVQQGVSDIHLKVGRPPIYRKDGRLVPHKGAMVLQPIHIKEWVEHMAGERQREILNEMGEVDFAYALHGVARFRVNAFYQRELAGLVARVIPNKIMTMDELNLPRAIGKLATKHRGLVLVTGATGSGKSTTLAAMIDAMNTHRSAHILTVEDPIEFVHEDKKGVVNQREVGQDTGSFLSALRAALRQDPDVILIGEMRDVETIETALHAAETGHLVLSTLHTLDATETIARIIGMFTAHQQAHIRKVLGQVLQGVVSQRLVPTVGGKGRVAACEIMVVTELVRECIWDPDRTHEVREYMAKAGTSHGSQTFDMALVAHYRAGLVDEKTVYEFATNPSDVKLLLSGIS